MKKSTEQKLVREFKRDKDAALKEFNAADNAIKFAKTAAERRSAYSALDKAANKLELLEHFYGRFAASFTFWGAASAVNA